VVTAGFVGFITSEPEVVSAANVWHVGTGPGNISATINGGISWASDGDTVYVHSGTYYENVVVDKTINLIGENRDTTIINGSGIGRPVYVSADWVNITGFTATGSGGVWGGAGIELDKVQNCRVIDNKAWDNINGIILNLSNNNILANNIASQNIKSDGNGFYFTYSNNNTIANNTLFMNDDGIFLFWSSYNTFIENNFSYNNDGGIKISYSSHNSLANNTFFMNLGGIGISYCSYGYNTIIGNTISSNTYGIKTRYSSYNTIIGNTISSNWWGIYVDYSSYNTFIGNTISLSMFHGIYIEFDGYNTIYHNVFIDNNGDGVQATDYVGTNIWNDSYPSGGNYWNDWLTPDFKKGPLQDMNGPDGIVDFNYSLEGGSGARDCYPLTTPPPDAAVPDLEVTGSDIIFDPASPVTNGTMVWISATIHNIGLGVANDVIVRFYFGSPGSPGSYQIGSDIHIPSIGGGSTTDVEVQWTAGPIGIHDIYVVIDPDNTITEMNEGNNIASKALEVIEIENLPPTPYIKAVGEDIILNWTQPSTIGISHYLLYRATSQTGFDFSNVWVNTTQHDDNGIVPLRTTWNDTGAVSGLAPSEYYYVIRTVSTSGDVSSTSRTVGKWTTKFNQGVSTFALPLEPLDTLFTHELTSTMNASYLRWMNTTTHTWMQHNIGDSSINNTQMKMGEGYEVKFSNQTNFTFTGMSGAMIRYDDDNGFVGFDPGSNARTLTVTVEPNGDVNLSWQEPAIIIIGSWNEVYYSSARDGFFGTLGIDYFLVDRVDAGINTSTHIDARANDPGARLFFMVVPFNSLGVRGASTYSIGIWTEEYLAGYDTFGIPLKIGINYTADWYCDNIPNTVGINYHLSSENRWTWHSTRMLQGAYDPVLVMGEGYQISTSGSTKFTFIGV